MKQFIKTRLRESLLEEEQLKEVNWKGLAAGAAMGLGTLGAQGQTTQPQTTQPQTTDVKPLSTSPATGTKSMYGTPEQRAAAKAKREGQRKINFDNFVMGAYQRANKISGLVEIVNDAELKSGCSLADKEEADYLNGSSYDMPKIVYRELKDGKKVKINIKKYQRYIEQHKNDEDIPTPGLYTPRDTKNAEKTTGGPSFFDSLNNTLNPFKERNGCIYSDEDKSGVKK
jgi:hypothetical protein